MGLSERAAVALLWLLPPWAEQRPRARLFQPELVGPRRGVLPAGMGVFAVYLLRIRMYDEREGEALDSSRMTPLVLNFRYKRQILEVIVDLCLVAIAYYGAYRLRFDEELLGANFPYFYRSLPLIMGAQMLALFFVGIYKTVWRNFRFAEILSIVKGTLLGMFTAELAILHLYRFESYSRALFAIYAVLLALMLTASHALFVLLNGLLERSRKTAGSAGDRRASATAL